MLVLLTSCPSPGSAHNIFPLKGLYIEKEVL